MRVFLTGGTGLIGRRIVALLGERGDLAVVLSRSAERARATFRGAEHVEVVEGDPTCAGAWQDRLAGCDAVINLAGADFGERRWNAQVRQILHDSRVDATRFVVEGLAALPEPERPRVLVSASGTDYYSLADPDDIDADDEVTEEAPPGESYLSRLCVHWEEEAYEADALGVRVVCMRTGMVIGRGAAFERMVWPFRYGLGGPLASGRQWASWIHLDDAAGAYLFALESEALRGPVNLVAPDSARQRELAAAIGAALRRPSRLRVPGFAVRAVGGQLAEYVIRGRRTAPTALLRAGYEFRCRNLREAVRSALQQDSP